MNNLNQLFCISLQQKMFVYVFKRRSNTSHIAQTDLNPVKMWENVYIRQNKIPKKSKDFKTKIVD